MIDGLRAHESVTRSPHGVTDENSWRKGYGAGRAEGARPRSQSPRAVATDVAVVTDATLPVGAPDSAASAPDPAAERASWEARRILLTRVLIGATILLGLTWLPIIRSFFDVVLVVAGVAAATGAVRSLLLSHTTRGAPLSTRRTSSATKRPGRIQYRVLAILLLILIPLLAIMIAPGL